MNAMEASLETPRKSPAGSGGGALPNTIVIGAQKCGTSTLHYYMGFHPEISASSPKELNFFIESSNWERGVDWYRSHFDPGKAVRLESSPNYTTWPHHEGIPERMAQLVPDAKLIFMVRDPVARIEAHWVHNYAKRRERGTMIETITHPSTTYVLRSRYFMQIERFLEHFDRSQILVFQQSDLRDSREAQLREVFEFVGVDPDFHHKSFNAVRHRTSKKRRASKAGMKVQEWSRTDWGRKIPKVFWNYAEGGLRLSRPIERPNLREQLPDEVLDVLREDAIKLREFTGREFANWSIWT
ncbi:MAG TPA: sulfotransferase [Solirubrobacterales bacterium]